MATSTFGNSGEVIDHFKRVFCPFWWSRQTNDCKAKKMWVSKKKEFGLNLDFKKRALFNVVKKIIQSAGFHWVGRVRGNINIFNFGPIGLFYFRYERHYTCSNIAWWKQHRQSTEFDGWRHFRGNRNCSWIEVCFVYRHNLHGQ